MRSTPAKAAARVHLVGNGFLQRNAGRFGSGRNGGFAILRANPDFDLVLGHDCGRGLRFHGGVIQIRGVILGLDAARGIG